MRLPLNDPPSCVHRSRHKFSRKKTCIVSPPPVATARSHISVRIFFRPVRNFCIEQEREEKKTIIASKYMLSLSRSAANGSQCANRDAAVGRAPLARPARGRNGRFPFHFLLSSVFFLWFCRQKTRARASRLTASVRRAESAQIGSMEVRKVVRKQKREVKSEEKELW